MDAYTALALLVFGLFILIEGARLLVRGASSVARQFGLSGWFIGVVIAGIGTSIPEFSVTVASAFQGSPIGLSTVLGSNIFNMLAILGVSALFAPFAFKRDWNKDLLFNVGAIAVAFIFVAFSFFGDGVGISRAEGLVLSTLLLLWLFYMFKNRNGEREGKVDQAVFAAFTSVFLVALGFAGVIFGGIWVVDSGATLALYLGLSEEIVGLSAIAIGTSLPELAVSLVAALRGQAGLAVGNVIGSNIFDFLGILGLAALIHPLPVSNALTFDFLVVLASALLLMGVLRVGTRDVLTRGKGAFLLLCYLAYFLFLLFRG